MTNLIASCANDVQPWDHYKTRDEYGHLLKQGQPIGSKVYHPRWRLLSGGLYDPNGRLMGKCYSHALACRLG